MGNTATIEIDCDADTVTVQVPVEDDLHKIKWPLEGPSKAEMVATLLAMQSRDLMAMSLEQLRDRQLQALGVAK